MTPLEILALGEQCAELIVKTAELWKAVQKGEVTGDEVRKRLVDYTFEMQRAVDAVHGYLDTQYVDAKFDPVK